MKQLLIRQGDVLFAPIAALPAGARKKRKDGAAAYGEVTGHSHAVMTPETAEVLEIGGGVYISVSDRGIAIRGDVDRLSPELDRILADPSEKDARKQRARELREALPKAGAIFLHGTATEREERPIPARDEDRHFPIALAPGAHRIGPQREYSPEEIRNVVD